MSILEAIKKDGNLALKYLERKCPTEFSARHIIVHKDESEKWWSKEQTDKARDTFAVFFGEFLKSKKWENGASGKTEKNVG